MTNPPTSVSAHHAAITACTACPRLIEYCRQVAATRVRRFRDETYWGGPVPGFGDPDPVLLIVGLAPAAHGANRTGRMFTGDESGNWLYEALHRYGFANQPTAYHREDGLTLYGAYVTASAHCAPPDNKPTRDELDRCRRFLERELQLFRRLQVVVTLGRIALDNYLKAARHLDFDPGRPTFGHNAVHRPPDPRMPQLITSYHPSRQNTQTGRLTRDQWHAVWARARELIGTGT